MGRNWKPRFLVVLLFVGVAIGAHAAQEEAAKGGEEAPAEPITDDQCFLCHEDPSLTKVTEAGTELSLFVDKPPYDASIHAALSCTGCHTGIVEVPHEPELPAVNCGDCHGEEAELYAKSLHGQAQANKDPLAPECWDCHGKHDILPLDDPKSRTNPIHIPEMCGTCHAEDAPVAKSRNIDQHDILTNYEDSMHATGLYQQGLTVTAVCTSCHTAHNVLPHTDPQSSIHRDNIVGVCTQCHALIEQVHEKVIEGKLWEEQPEVIPVCVDCHQPHVARKVFYEEGVSDRDCMTCHQKEHARADGTSLAAVDTDLLAHSTHNEIRCAQCHTELDPQNAVRPCAPIVEVKVDCSICHAEQVDQHTRSIHGQLLAKGDADAPVCLDCHGGHGTLSKENPASLTHPRRVPELCGTCHRDGEKAASRIGPEFAGLVQSFTESVHGRGLAETGLLATATCTSCHTAHLPLPPTDPESSVNPAHIADTCGQCHQGIEEKFVNSVHSPAVSKQPPDKLPVCSSCHTAHSISRTEQESFKEGILETCGKCHEYVTETYFDTYHGKVSKLGTERAARCYDCHGAHDILPPSDPESHLSRDNIVDTCAKCHEGSHLRFAAGYLTHATHHDPEKYPALFYAFWAMTILLVGTFSFFGLHTLMWFPRSLREHRKKKQLGIEAAKDRVMVRRFDPIVRQMHFVLILSFFALALTGMALKFSYMPWAQWLAESLGGFSSAGVIHRIAAVAMFVVFFIHLGYVAQRKRKTGSTWKQILLGPGTLLPTWRDAQEFWATVKWFRGKGPRPQYGEWTYWEKFDYFAVFWGVAIIGSTGLLLWFPELFTWVLPGWLINVATIIHSDEALLAVGFIFTIHFFNTHFRPEKFPMDMVMFTGVIPEEELKEERPRYYEALKESGELDKRITVQAPKEFRFWAAIFGTLALVVGFGLVLLIIWSMFAGYIVDILGWRLEL
ncbi:MAG: cytochrome c3 family protein [Candidatus Hydrogenedentes bacterium]|nr:cytochrome c3 family protein [Candidatus Hydrogenedentota bacterium]